MVLYNFKKIQVVPNGKEFVDIVLTRTQRKTPTIIHKAYPIASIRKFYMRKVKFTQATINEKLSHILSDFPILDEIHPFYGDLMNVLYDKDHYKLALGQINTCRHLVDNIAKDYVRLLKFADSLYRCKQLKKAGLGRMVKVLRRQHSSLEYLEEVRKHMARLPNIDPNTRTLLMCGYPNVGKSSFMNKLTRANVEVQPYPFTTKSLFVGHTDYKYLRWQVIDTPGILDQALEDRNTIEMQSITALAHLRCAVLYFVDISEQCGYSIKQQCDLFDSILPLFGNKPLIIVLNKIDVRRPEQLAPEESAMIQKLINSVPGALALPMSSMSEEGIAKVKETACDLLLQVRTDLKMKGTKKDEIVSRIHVSIPQPRDDKDRPAFIPETVIAGSDGKVARRKLAEWEEQQKLYENFDPDYTGIDWRQHYLLDDDEWRFDIIPEIVDGQNIADFYTEELERELAALLEEEAQRIAELEALDVNDEDYEQLTADQLEQVRLIREKRAMLINAHRLKKLKNHSFLPKNKHAGSADQLHDHLAEMGIDPERAMESLRDRSLSRSRSRGRKRDRDAMEVDTRSSRSRSVKPSEGLRDDAQREKAEKMARQAQKLRNRFGKRGEGDREIPTKMPKHLFSGKRGNGKTDRR